MRHRVARRLGLARRGTEELLLAAVEMVAQRKGQVLRAENLSGSVRRTIVGAPAALGACIEIQNRLPREMLDSSDADRRRKRIGRLGRGANFLHELLGVLRHRLQAPGWLEASQKDVGNRGDDVKMLRAWEQGQKQEDKHCMGPKPNARQKHEPSVGLAVKHEGKERSRRWRPDRPGPVPMFAGERGRNLQNCSSHNYGTY